MEKQYNQLLKQWSRYIEKIANSWSNGDDELTKDLEQEGRIALLTLDYQPNKGDEETYVKMMIRMAMKKYLTNNLRTVRIPSHIQHSSEWKDDTQIMSRVSLDAKVFEDSDTTVADLIVINEEDTTPTDEELTFKERYKKAINELKPQWQYILLNYYGYNENESPMTLEELGIEIGISKQAVSLQLAKAKEKIREIMKK